MLFSKNDTNYKDELLLHTLQVSTRSQEQLLGTREHHESLAIACKGSRGCCRSSP